MRSADALDYATGWLGGALMMALVSGSVLGVRVAAIMGLAVGVPLIVAGLIMKRREK